MKRRIDEATPRLFMAATAFIEQVRHRTDLECDALADERELTIDEVTRELDELEARAVALARAAAKYLASVAERRRSMIVGDGSPAEDQR